jgi:hypothetical protein
MLVSALPIILMTAASPAFAADAVNSASVAMPSGAFETNATNNSATDTDTIFAALVATNNSASGINGLIGATAVLNVLTGDTVNGSAATTANVVISVAPSSTVPSQLTFNAATGSVDVNPGTAAGTYSFDYQICEQANPTNCKTATISVTVVAAAITADADGATGINGATGANNVVNALDGDTFNAVAATTTAVEIKVVTPATPASVGAPVPVLDITTGQVNVPAGTPAGTYTIRYEICDKLNPTNCAANQITIEVVASPIVATNDSATGINGASGATAVVNAFTSDQINGAAASAANAVLSVAPSSTVPSELTFNATTGSVDVVAGTPAGTYSFDYQICEKLNPTNCKTATISVTVVAAAITADPDDATGINGATGANNVVNVLSGDTFNSVAATTTEVQIAVITPATPASVGAPVPVLNTSTGQISVPAGTPAGTYTISYGICDKLNPTNCADNIATIEVVASPIVATNDNASGINGLTGATAVVNAFTSDQINGAAASAANAVLSVAPSSTVPSELTFNATTGSVDVVAGTPAGTYSFDYQICEKLNPSNCKTATISVTVVAAAISADPDAATGINGATGASNVTNVLDGDTLNSVAATTSTVDIKLITPATPASVGAPVPTLDTATGQVNVPAGTPAGTYTIDYEICDKINPTNCSANTATIEVVASPIVATNDNASGINGLVGATAVVNAFTSDQINGAAASAANAVLSVAPSSTVPSELTFNPTTGSVDVVAGTPAGTYSFDYQICEKLNPSNCKTATISVTVVAAAITADTDAATGINGATGASNVTNVLDGDTLNSVAATTSTVDIKLITPATPASAGAPVPTLDIATGEVSVPAGTPAGSYTIDYEICEKLNPTNCAANTVTVEVVASPIVAANDSATGINGMAGAIAVVNAFTADTVNGAAASAANAVLSVAPTSTVPAQLTFDPATGNVDVVAGTPAGTYSFDYQICEKLNPSNCKTATISVTVVPAVIAADPDSVTGVNGATGVTNVTNVLDGDTLDGSPVTPLLVDIKVVTPATPASAGAPVPTLDTATGQVSVPAGTPAGTYTINYEICEKLNPTNCSANVVTVEVVASPIVAANDSATGINGMAGSTAVVNAFTADTVNGAAASAANAVLSVAPTSTVPAELTFDPATGNVDVKPGTPAGTYSFDYQICEKLNPSNCKTATISVTVVAAAITADPDSTTGVNGATGATNVTNVLDGDTLDGSPVTPLLVDISVVTPATPVGGAPVPTLNISNGQIDVPAGTPAGTYTIEYQICEKLNPTNCSTNVVTVEVIAPPIAAANDTAAGVNGLVGATAVVNAFTADTVNGVAASATNAILSVAPTSTVPAELTFDPATGNVDVKPGTPAGTYSFTYQLCERLNPSNCATATITVTVVPAPIVASPETAPTVLSNTGGSNLINVLTNDTLNGQPIEISTVILTVTTPAANPGVTLDPATGMVSVAPNTPAGSYAIEYQLCERLNPTNCVISTVTVVVEEVMGSIAGTVFTDVNADRILNEEDPRRGGWIVEVLKDDVVVGTATTDANGNYQVDGLLKGSGYEVRFRSPENRVIYGEINDVTVAAATVLRDQNQPIDPSGVVFNSVTRQPVSGVTVTMVGTGGTPLPTACFIDPTQRSQITGASGEYRFDVQAGAAPECPAGETIYRIAVTAPAGFSNDSTVLLPQPGPLDPTGLSSPVRVSPGALPPASGEVTYYLTFRFASGDPDVVYNHIAIDPFLSRAPLIVTKTSTKRSASTGDLVPYEITVRNDENVQRAGVEVVDILPPGMKYVVGSALVGGIGSEPVVTDRKLSWKSQIIPAKGQVRYNLTLVVGAGVTGGEKANTGVAEQQTTGTAISNRGTAVVSIVPSSVFDCSELLGKVFEDTNRNGYQDEGEPGVPAVRLATVNGQLVTTDGFGRYHIACAAVPDARIGSNFVLKLDTRTLPLGWDVTSDNPRSIRLTRGKFGELNFGVAPQETNANVPGTTPANRNGKGE